MGRKTQKRATGGFRTTLINMPQRTHENLQRLAEAYAKYERGKYFRYMIIYDAIDHYAEYYLQLNAEAKPQQRREAAV